MSTRKHSVTFLSPGTLFAETASKPIESWDPKTAAQLALKINARYRARPYGFYFLTHLTAPPVPDGEGGMLEVRPKEVARSGVYFLTGDVVTYRELVQRNDPAESILRTNMKGNNWNAVVVNCNSYRTTQPFEAKDVVIDWDGTVVVRGADYY